jgi:hypothetical protein
MRALVVGVSLLLGGVAAFAQSVNPGQVSPPAYSLQPSGRVSTSLPTIVGDGFVFGGATAATPSAAGTGYAPLDQITLADGAPSVHGVLSVATTKVVSATVASGGSGGTNGTQTVTGTTGTGTKFQAVVTVTGGAITAVNSISQAGSYTVNPTVLTAEPVTGASLVGATLNVVMGVATATVLVPGQVTSAPANPVAQASTSGVGTGATFTTTYAVLAQTLFGGAIPVNGWKVCNGNASGDFWVSDNGVTPTANGPSSLRVAANSTACAHTEHGESPAGSRVQLLGTTIGQPFIARSW